MTALPLIFKHWTGAAGEYFTADDWNRIEDSMSQLAAAVGHDLHSGIITLSPELFLQAWMVTQYMEYNLVYMDREITNFHYTSNLAKYDGAAVPIDYRDYDRWETALENFNSTL